MSTNRSSRTTKPHAGAAARSKGCMSGILCLFDFRRRVSRKVLVDGSKRTNAGKERYDLIGHDRDSNMFKFHGSIEDVDTTTKSVKMLMQKEMASSSLSSSSYKKIQNPSTEQPNMISNSAQKSSFRGSFGVFRKKLGHADVGGNNRRHRRWLFGGKMLVNKIDAEMESKRHLLDILDGGGRGGGGGVGNYNHQGAVNDGQQVQFSLDKITLTSSSDYFLSKSPIYSPGRYKDPGLSPRRLPFFPTYGRAGRENQGNNEGAFHEFDGRVENSSPRYRLPGFSPRRSGCSPPPRISSPEEDKSTSTVINKDSHSLESIHIDGCNPEDNIIIEKTNGPSPVSVLDHPFASDDISSHESAEDSDKGLSYVIIENSSGDEASGFPASARLISFDDELDFNGKNHRITTCMEDEEFKHAYVISLLEASCLTNCETWELRSPYSDDQFLDPVLYNQIKTPTGEVPGDLKLLFDCINEVLIKIHRKYFLHPISYSFTPPLIKHSLFPSPESLVGEVLEGIHCHFNASKTPLLSTLLYEIIAKDFGSTTTTWVGMVSGIDNIEKAVGDEILENMLAETAAFLVLPHVS